jgi:gamma-aminobutyric acid type B receptor
VQDRGNATNDSILLTCSLDWMFNTQDDCSIEVPEDLNMIPFALKLIAFVMLGFSVVVIVLCGLWLYVQWNSSQVRASQPFFLLLVLFGCLVSSSTILALAQEDGGDGPVKCMAIPWLYSVGFSITFGTLYSKIRRIYKVFTTEYAVPPVAGSLSSYSISYRNRVTVEDTMFFIGAVLMLDLIIMVLWQVLDPLEWQRVTIRKDQFGHPLESEGYCVSDTWEIFSSIIGAFHLGLLAVAAFMCYKARDIPTKYSEHKFVSIAVVSNLQIFMIGGKCSQL